MPIPFPDLLAAIRQQYRLNWHGIHGIGHWARVWGDREAAGDFDRREAGRCGLFAIFHDACRENDGRDPEHGRRGAELAKSLRGTLISSRIPSSPSSLSPAPCTRKATKGLLEADIIVQVCWDADRLDPTSW